MSRRPRFETLLRVAQANESRAGAELAAARTRLEERQRALTQLEGFLSDYSDAYRALAGQQVRAHLLAEQSAFLARLDRAVTDAREACGRANSERTRLFNAWHTAHRRTLALETAMERRRRGERLAREQREQSLGDEIGRRRVAGPGRA